MKDFVPVEGIQHPDIFGVFVLIAEFLADDAVLRKVRLDHPAHYGLGRPIGLRYRIEVATGALVFDAEKSCSEKWQDGFARGRRETVNKGGKVNHRHAIPHRTMFELRPLAKPPPIHVRIGYRIVCHSIAAQFSRSRIIAAGSGTASDRGSDIAALNA